MKEAKTEAEKIIAEYRAEMEGQHKEALGKVNAKTNSINQDLQNSTNSDLGMMK
jgi:vacuolar-type H+-ATPase subunit H